MTTRIGFKLVADSKRYKLRTSSSTITHGYMEISIDRRHPNHTSIYVYTKNDDTNGWSNKIYSNVRGSDTKAPVSVRESTGVITIGRYKITCTQRKDFLKLANALKKFGFIDEEKKTVPTKKKSVRKNK